MLHTITTSPTLAMLCKKIMFVNIMNEGARFDVIVACRAEEGLASGVQFKVKDSLRGCSLPPGIFRMLYASAHGSPRTEY